MKKEIIEKIVQKTGVPDLTDLLAERLSGSELNSLLLEVFNKNLQNISPALLLKQYQANRFVQPAETDMIGFLKSELQVLELLQQEGFQPIELSPVAQLGSCSVVGPVDQKKIISATRNTEIMADATNSIALHIAAIKKSGVNTNPLHFCTIHRHVRAQPLREKGHTPHFKIGCMVSSGRDTGSYLFESMTLLEHFQVLDSLFREVYGIAKTRFKLQKREGYDFPDLLMERVCDHIKQHSNSPDVFIDAASGHNDYYKGIQFKMIVEIKGRELEIADGGFVDWTQQLLGNKKERLLISGFGFELIYKLQNGIL